MLLIHRYSTPFLTGPSLHFTALHLTSPTINTLHGTLRFNPLHCTTLHFTSLQFTALFRQFTTHSLSLQFTTLITLLTLFLKALGLQGRVPKISAGNRFQSRMFLFTKEYFPISVLCLLFNSDIPATCFCFKPIHRQSVKLYVNLLQRLHCQFYKYGTVPY